jgi:inosine-uridine nucleoside N-ribohydrolase
VITTERLAGHGWYGRATGRTTIVDSDTDNEIDDHFAVAWALAGLDVAALHAAPFRNERSTDAAAGMRQSAAQLRRLTAAAGRPGVPVLEGAAGYLAELADPRSAAVDDLITRAEAGPVTLVCIGAITNLACALSLRPEIAGRLSVVWLAGQPPWSWDEAEFNFSSDPEATAAVLAAPLDLLVVPCRGVAELLFTTEPELAAGLPPGPVADHLLSVYREQVPDTPGIARPIWDLAAVACLLTPEAVVVADAELRGRRTPVVQWIDRNAVFTDFFGRLR